MIEILFLSRFARHLASMAKAKGHSGWWGGLGVLMWIGGELIGFVIGAMADLGAGMYLAGLALAALGATISYFIVRSLAPTQLMQEMNAPQMPYAPPPIVAPQDTSNPYRPPQT